MSMLSFLCLKLKYEWCNFLYLKLKYDFFLYLKLEYEDMKSIRIIWIEGVEWFEWKMDGMDFGNWSSKNVSCHDSWFGGRSTLCVQTQINPLFVLLFQIHSWMSYDYMLKIKCKGSHTSNLNSKCNWSWLNLWIKVKRSHWRIMVNMVQNPNTSDMENGMLWTTIRLRDQGLVNWFWSIGWPKSQLMPTCNFLCSLFNVMYVINESCEWNISFS